MKVSRRETLLLRCQAWHPFWDIPFWDRLARCFVHVAHYYSFWLMISPCQGDSGLLVSWHYEWGCLSRYHSKVPICLSRRKAFFQPSQGPGH